MNDLPSVARAPLLLIGLAALVIGVGGGLERLGVAAHAPLSGIVWHGALMASAFFGTLISLERAVALAQAWAYTAPVANGLGGVFLIAGRSREAFFLFTVGASLFLLASCVIFLRQRAQHTGVLTLGAAALLAADIFIAAGLPSDAPALGWIAFFVLTIGGERLELSRLVRPPAAARVAFTALCLALFLSALAAPIRAALALGSTGALLVALAAWLWRYDIASRTVRSSGLTRYIALCLLAGYAWLALGGAILILAANGVRETWDAGLHAIMLGFVFSMVFGHAPVILPALLRVAFPYRAWLYGPLALLHATLVLRIAGDLTGNAQWRESGGLGNAAAIVLFICTAAGLVFFARTTPPGARGRGQRGNGELSGNDQGTPL